MLGRIYVSSISNILPHVDHGRSVFLHSLHTLQNTSTDHPPQMSLSPGVTTCKHMSYKSVYLYQSIYLYINLSILFSVFQLDQI